MRSLGLGIVAVSLLGIVGGTQMHPQQEDPVIAESPAVDGGVGIAHPVYALNPQDDRALVAYATDVFLGRVLEQTGTIGAPTSAPGRSCRRRSSPSMSFDRSRAGRPVW
jgi:hypothetical protein